MEDEPMDVPDIMNSPLSGWTIGPGVPAGFFAFNGDLSSLCDALEMLRKRRALQQAVSEHMNRLGHQWRG
jgi:hypothetical protein